MSYLRSGEHEGQYPDKDDESRTPLVHVETLHGIAHRDEPVDADQHQNEGAQVQAEHLQELEELARDVAPQPGDVVAPDRIAGHAEDGDQQISYRQMQEQSVDRRAYPLFPAVLRNRVNGRQIAGQTQHRHDCQYDGLEVNRIGQFRRVFQARDVLVQPDLAEVVAGSRIQLEVEAKSVAAEIGEVVARFGSDGECYGDDAGAVHRQLHCPRHRRRPHHVSLGDASGSSEI